MINITNCTLFFDKPNLIEQKATQVSYILCGKYYNNCEIKQISILVNIYRVVLFSKSEATKYQQKLFLKTLQLTKQLCIYYNAKWITHQNIIKLITL